MQHSPSVWRAPLASSRMASGACSVETTRTRWTTCSAPAQTMACARIQTRLTRSSALLARRASTAPVKHAPQVRSKASTALRALSVHGSTSKWRAAACGAQPALCLPTYQEQQHASAAVCKVLLRWKLSQFMQPPTGQRAPQPSSRAAPASSRTSSRLAVSRAKQLPTIYSLPPAHCARGVLPDDSLPPI